MDIKIREIALEDKLTVINMMEEFYSSPAVFTNGSTEIFNANLDAVIEKSPYLDGFVMLSNNKIIGYTMVAKSYSTEFGKPCYWIEDIYLKEAYRGQGLGKRFFDYITNEYKDCIFRLEVEKENEQAVKLYQKCGFSVLPYMEMKL